jgi:hypothetical protein
LFLIREEAMVPHSVDGRGNLPILRPVAIVRDPVEQALGRCKFGRTCRCVGRPNGVLTGRVELVGMRLRPLLIRRLGGDYASA